MYKLIRENDYYYVREENCLVYQGGYIGSFRNSIIQALCKLPIAKKLGPNKYLIKFAF